MKIEIWADVVCPWCYIGKRRFEQALALFAHRDEVEVVFRSFELDPTAPATTTETMADMLARKFNTSHDEALTSIARTTAIASAVGLEFHLDEAKMGNTFDAHRLLHLASKFGLQGELHERFSRAYFTEARAIGDTDTLIELCLEVGLSEDEVKAVAASNQYSDDVRIEEATAKDLGVTGVPFFVIDRTYGVAGAQGEDVLLDAMQQAWDEAEQNRAE